MASSEASTRRGPSALTRIITKIGISTLFGIVAFLLSLWVDAAGGATWIVGLGASIFVGGVAFLAQFLIDVESRIDNVEDSVGRVEHGYDRHNRQTEEMIREEFQKINKATRLFGAVEASALKTDAITQLVEHSTRVVGTPGTLVSDFAQAEIMRLSSYLRDLGQGADVTYEGEDRDWLLGLTKVATVSIDATSLTTVDAGGRGFVDGGLWTSSFGVQYLKTQRDAIIRGVEIRRIFIFDRPELQHDKDVERILREHHKIGVKVRTLSPEDIPAMVYDFIVIDNVLSYQATPATRMENSRPLIANTTLVTNSERVKQRIDRYKDLWDSAAEFDPADQRRAE